MDEHVIIIESGYKTASANYRIKHTDPMSRSAALEVYGALRTGTSDLLPAVDGAVVVDVSSTQFLRIGSKRGATLLDRVTLGSALVQQG